jgi:hypothetical protein
MDGDLGRAGRAGAWVVLALCGLTACNAAPGGTAASPAAAAQTAKVVQAVQAATDRSGVQQSALTLDNGQRVRRLTLQNGFNHVLVARMGPDGKPVVSCVDSAPAAEAFLTTGKGAGQ